MIGTSAGPRRGDATGLVLVLALPRGLAANRLPQRTTENRPPHPTDDVLLTTSSDDDLLTMLCSCPAATPVSQHLLHLQSLWLALFNWVPHPPSQAAAVQKQDHTAIFRVEYAHVHAAIVPVNCE